MRNLLFVLLFFTCVLRGQSADPFSPTVTRAESEQIQEALEASAEDAVKGIELLAARDPEKSGAAVDFTLGNLYFQSEQYNAAKTAYERALAKFPTFRAAKINLGRVYLLLEDPPKAIKVYQELVRDGIADAETYLLLGHGLMMENRSVSAESAYRQGLLLDQDLAEAKQGLLNALMRQERYQEALFLSDELLQENPDRRMYWAVRANAYLSLGQHAQALIGLEQARRLGNADAEMYRIMGELYLERGSPELAVERFRTAMETGDLSSSQKTRVVQAMLEVGAFEEAQALLTLLENDLEIKEGPILKFKSRILMAQGKDQEAVPLLEKGLNLDPLDGEGLLMLSEIYVEQGMIEKAKLFLERAGRIKGFEVDSLIQQALIQVSEDNVLGAVVLLERAQVFEERREVANYLQQLRRMLE